MIKTIFSSVVSRRNIFYFMAFMVLILINLTYGLYMESIVWYFLGSSAYYLNEGVYFGRGFLFILVPSFLVLSPVIGNLSDQYGHVRVMRWCSFIIFASFILMGYATKVENLGLVVTSLFLFGVGSCIWVSGYAFFFQKSQKSTQRFRAIFYLSICAHFFFFGGILFSELRGDPDPSGFIAYWWPAVLPLIAFILLCFVRSESRSAERRQISAGLYHFPQRISRLFLSKKFRWVMLIYTLCVFSRGLFLEGPFEVVVFVGNSPVTKVGHYITYSNLALFAGVFLLVILNYFYGITKKYLLWGAILVAVGLIMGFIDAIQSVASIFVGLGTGFILSVCLYYVSYSRGARFYGILAGVYISVWGICMALANIVVSSLVHNFSGLVVLVTLTTIIIAMMIMIIWIIILKLKEEKNNMGAAYE